MTDTVKVEGWILDYACFHREFDVLNAICKRYPDIINIAEHLNVPLVRYTTAVIHHVVDKSKFESFAFIIELLDHVYQVLVENIPFQDYARLSCGLKMQILVHYLLKCETVLAVSKLNQYFPRTGMKNSQATSKELNKLNRMISSFRKFYLPLLANENQRKFYLQQEYPEEYGPRYTESLKKKTFKFINLVEEYMPIPAIQKILNAGAATLSSIPINLSPVPYEILLEYCMNKTSLSCADMLDILTSISPLHTQDRVVIFNAQESDASDSIAVQSCLIESLFEEETCAVHPVNTEQMSSTTSPDYTRLRNSKVETNTTTDNIINNKLLINANEKNGYTKTWMNRCHDSSLQSNSVARVNGRFPITKSRNATELKCKSDINSTNPSKKIKLSNVDLDKKAIEDFQHLKRKEPASDSDSSINVSATTCVSCDKQIPNHVSPIMIVKTPLSKEYSFAPLQDEREVIEEGLLTRDASQEEASCCQETCTGNQSSVSDTDKTTIPSGDDESHIIHSSIVNEDLEMSNEGVLQDLSACIIKNRKCQCQSLCVIKLVRNKEIDELYVQKGGNYKIHS